MKKILLFIAVITASFSVQAQKEMNWWYFGGNSGLNFNITQPAGGVPDLPIPVTGPLYTSEGCFSISDSNGNFLFASDGSTVYDKTKAIMSNGTGLGGGSSSAQSGIVIPFPGNPNKFYIITVETHGTGIAYSLVDLSLNGGLGQVVTKYNRLLGATSVGGENIAAVRKKDNSGYWMVHQRGPDFYVWGITAAGIAPPQIYNFPGIYGGSGEGSAGKLTFSTDNTKLAACLYLGSKITTASFDTATGVVSNAIQQTLGVGSYTAEFSPSGEWLYIGSLYYTCGKIKYDDLRAGASYTPLASVSADDWQLGPDKRIYGVRRGTRDLYVIMNPDDGGTDIKYLPGYLINTAEIGLPTFMSSFFSMKPTARKFACTGYDYKFTTTVDMSVANPPVKLSLDYGDGNTGTINLVAGQTNYNITHVYNVAGTYTVTITPVKADNSTLTPKTVSAEAVDCLIRTNRMIRVDLQNANTATGQ